MYMGLTGTNIFHHLLSMEEYTISCKNKKMYIFKQ
jgi:hypothetical protein